MYDMYFMMPNVDMTQYRSTELQFAKNSDLSGAALFDISYYVKKEAGLGIGRTLFITMTLLIGAVIFQYDTNKLVIEPIVDMIHAVK